jgi:hypothetical protein
MRSAVILCLVAVITLLVAPTMRASVQDNPGVHAPKKPKKERLQVPPDIQAQDSVSTPPLADKKDDSAYSENKHDVTDVQLGALQDKTRQLESQLQDVTAKLNAVANESRKQRIPEDPISSLGVLAIGIGILALGISVGAAFWMKNAAERGIRKALRDAGLL